MNKRKIFGQIFLNSDFYAEKFVEYLNICCEDNIIEIGSGKCIISKKIAKFKYKNYKIIEIDKHLYNFTKNSLIPLSNNIEVFNNDCLDFNFKDLGYSFKLISNLAFSLTKKFIFDILIPNKNSLNLIVLGLQKEFVDEILIKDGKCKSFIGVILNTLFHVEFLDIIDKKFFLPIPKVDTRIIRLCPKFYNDYVEFNNNDVFIEKYIKYVKEIFFTKKKKLKNIIKKNIFLIKELDKEKRPHEIKIENFIFNFIKCYGNNLI